MSQNTGNPVLDSLVNILAERPVSPGADYIRETHAALLACAEKEPGGLRRPNGFVSATAGPKERSPA